MLFVDPAAQFARNRAVKTSDISGRHNDSGVDEPAGPAIVVHRGAHTLGG
jgi:hypothetical protein